MMCRTKQIGQGVPRRHGFTLVELLVAVAIFTTVLAGVVLLFNNAVRVSKQGYQNQEAYGMVRGVAKRIEADLTGAHAALDMGLGDTFYGSPYGFTFISKVRTGDGPDDYDLARISYVIYVGPNGRSRNVDLDRGLDTQTDERDLTKYYGEGLRHGEPVLTQTDLDQEIADGRGDGSRTTYSLLRYVELNVDNLDTFDVDWTAAADLQFQEGGGDGSFNGIIGNAKDVLIPAIDQPSGFGAGYDSIVGRAFRLSDPPLCSTGDFECGEAVEKAARRDYWLRLLAGDFRIDYDFWAVENLDPEDYVIAEDLLFVNRLPGYTPNGVDGVQYITHPDDVDGLNLLPTAQLNLVSESMPMVQERHIAPILFASNQYTAYDPYVDGTPFSPTNYFFKYRAMGTATRVDENNVPIEARSSIGGGIFGTTVYEQERRGFDFGYWNDSRNIRTHRLFGFSNGSPTEGRLPEAIILDFTVFLPSVYPGAPDFERTFTQQIDAPVGYRRALPTTQQETVRNLDRLTTETIANDLIN